ncbi:MAG TPA: DUF2203 domain-containing protein [Candidatus Dormibacteraeota bacterium]|nr:DUF2203 domain-containing protein [Candidatus Dormibacteraeota bacterium]
MQRTRTYTVEEANRELPRVKRIVAQIAELSALLPELEDQARIAEYQSKRAGAGAEQQDRHQQAHDAAQGAEEELLKAVLSLNSMGIALKGPLEGLIDFPAIRDGEPIELCWKLGEERVEHWHRVGEGFAGRKKL